MKNQKTQEEKLLPSMEDVGELSGLETLHPGGFDLSKRIGEIVDMNGKKVLEVGSGRGAFACYFAKNFGAKITGIDLNTNMIKLSTNRAKEERVEDSTEFRIADASNLPFPDDSFDIVVSECGPVGLAPDSQKVVDEMVRVTKPGGYIVAHAPMWLKEIPEEKRKDIEKRIGGQMFTLSEWKDMLKNGGVAEIWEEDWSGIEQNGVDLTPAMVEKARKLTTKHGYTNFDLREADARRLPFPDETFDVLYNSYMLDLIPIGDFPIVLKEFHRVLKKGGRLVLLNFTKKDERPVFYEKVYKRVPYLLGGCRPVLMESFVKEAGFKDVRGEVPRLFPSLPSEIVTSASRRKFAYHCEQL